MPERSSLRHQRYDISFLGWLECKVGCVDSWERATAIYDIAMMEIMGGKMGLGVENDS